MPAAAGEQADRADVEIAQDLRTDTDIPPSLLSGSRPSGLFAHRFLEARRRNARGSFPEIDEEPALLRLELGIDGVEHFAPAENILDQILPVQPDRHVTPAADVAINQRKMLNAVIGRGIGDAARLADRRIDVEHGLLLHQPLARLAVADEVRNGDDLEPVLAGEGQYLSASHHRTLVVH